MKGPKIIFLLLTLLTRVSHAQFTDSFSDGEYTENPGWYGDQSKFQVNGGKLKLQAPAVPEIAFLSTPSQAIHLATWEFYLQMDFNPSSTNYAKIYLVSDQQTLSSPLNGYFIKAGNTSRDISLYRQNGTTETKIIDGLDDRINVALVKIRIKITRTVNGVWQLSTDVGLSGTFALEGTATDNTFTTSSYFGIQCTYTATRADKFWFDDIIVTGTVVPDTTPPVLMSTVVASAQQINLFFSESLDPNSAHMTSNYVIENLGSPSSVEILPDQRTVLLELSQPLTNGVTNNLQIHGIADQAGNIVVPVALVVIFFQPIDGKNKDVIFTELLPDPSPQIGMPNSEFVEIYNRSRNPFDLSGWILTDGSSIGIFPSQIILPGEYWIVTSVSAIAAYSGYGKTIGLVNFPTLNNDGDVVVLKGPSGLTIDSINYSTSWYRNLDKGEGGWSLELIDPDNPCGEEDNWTASENSMGGTPGRKNSVFANKPDLTSPVLQEVFPMNTSQLKLSFNEKLDPLSILSANFEIEPSRTISNVRLADISRRVVTVTIDGNFDYRDTYQIGVKNIRDCSGNPINPSTVSFGLPEIADSLDVVVNEILFNPRSGGVDFVEILNSSPKYLNLKNWKIGNYSNGIQTNSVVGTTGDHLMPPGSFVVFTLNPTIVKLQYPQSHEANLLVATLPSLPDDEGSFSIMNDAGMQIDAVQYSKTWHSEFLKSEEGVSLERISALASSMDKVNWTSASSQAGFATPGAINSQVRGKVEVGDGEVLVTPEIFSPGEGYEEFVQIQYHFGLSGWIANVKVFDLQGHLLATIANNEILGPEGFFRWDGAGDDGRIARIGYYVVWFEIFNSAGAVKSFRKRVIVSSR